MTKAITFVAAIVIISVFISWGLPEPVASAVYGLPNTVYDKFTVAKPGDPDRPVIQNWRNQRRAGVANVARGMSSTIPSSSDYYELNKNSARQIREYRVGEQKLNADYNGTRLNEGQVLTVRGRDVDWVDTFFDKSDVELFEGDIICARGFVSNPRLTQNDQVILVPPQGRADVKEVEEHTPHYAQFPMFAFLLRMDGSENKIFYMTDECIASPYSGKKLQLSVNGPYFNKLGAAPLGNNGGEFTITRIEHPQKRAEDPTNKNKQISEQKKEEPNTSTTATPNQGIFPRMRPRASPR